jgi:uncharacterized repeat protein (TIGR03843 family)
LISVEKTLHHLQNAELTVTGRLIDASNATLYARATLEGSEIACIYKPIAGERPLWDFQSGNLAQREYATFLLSNKLKIDVVPPTLLREGPYGMGMVQAWIEIDTEIDLMTFFQKDEPQLRQLALFDAMINNTDRKIGHLIPTAEGHLYACDHGVTFHEEDKLRTVLWQWAGNPLQEEEVSLLKRATSILEEVQFSDLLTESELDAARSRISRIIREGEFPHPSEDWPAVPWPPF